MFPRTARSVQGFQLAKRTLCRWLTALASVTFFAVFHDIAFHAWPPPVAADGFQAMFQSEMTMVVNLCSEALPPSGATGTAGRFGCLGL